MRTIKRTAQFKRDYKREKRRKHGINLDDILLKAVKYLVADITLPVHMRDHALIGNWKDCRDCHIKPDLVLIYRKPNTDTLELIRLGSHSELGF
ncbi:mRNA interferase toxin YafQ [Rickettsia tillamookensis]|uniref:mRNA interferase toxin YafQ n=1 Tax=Rickettsia tillamookensis TaxID=2761623 RepID=A0A9E6MI32_9RICK|nr:type II toxin-antitoxin system YafQ family toxin [Rickettsia tillamookensis]QQV75229.1 mRNA interferase toxin YafQ [Rickettsia tillamookensis]